MSHHGTQTTIALSSGIELKGFLESSADATGLVVFVGSDDMQVLRLNRMAMSRIPAQTQLVTIEGATHLFEEPGTLDQTAQHAADWFKRYLRDRSAERGHGQPPGDFWRKNLTWSTLVAPGISHWLASTESLRYRLR